MRQIKDKVGHVCGMLTVTSFNSITTKPSGKRESVWNCECKCGNSTIVRGGNLKNTESCGCVRKINKITTRDLKTRLVNVLGHHIDVSKVVYVKSDVKIHLVCKKHGDFYKDPFKALSGQGCPKCASRSSNLMPFAEFLRLVSLVQPDHFMFDRESYVDSNKLSVVCSLHGPFTQTKSKTLAGQIGCVKCRQPIHDVKTFIAKATEVHGDNYDYSHVTDITSTRSKATIICKKHGKFEQSVANHINGSGCNSCSVNGFNYQKEAILYVIEIITDTNTLYKIGITNLSVNERFLVKELKSVNVLYTEKFLIGRNAYVKEQRLLKMLEEYKYSGKNLFRRGNTEIVTVNPLMRLKEEFYE